MKLEVFTKRKMAMLFLTLAVMLIGSVMPEAFAQLTDDFSTDKWTDFSTDVTYEIYVDTSAEVLRFVDQCKYVDRDLSYWYVGNYRNVTVEFKINVTTASTAGRMTVGLHDAIGGCIPYVNPTANNTLCFLVNGPYWTPHGLRRMFSVCTKNGTLDWDVGAGGAGETGYDFALNTEYFVKIIKQGGKGIVELWDASKTVLHFRKDWGDIGLPILDYVVVSDQPAEYVSAGHLAQGYIDDLSVSWSGLVGGTSIPIGKLALLAPYITSAAIIIAITIGAVYTRKHWLKTVT